VVHNADTKGRIDSDHPERNSGEEIGMRTIAAAPIGLIGESSPASCCPRSSASSATWGR
jgi:hypothetical protein